MEAGETPARTRLTARHGPWTAALAAIGFYLVAMMIVARLMPAINEVPEAFPAVVLWRFRIASCGMQMVMWTTLGLVFGALCERAQSDRRMAAVRAG